MSGYTLIYTSLRRKQSIYNIIIYIVAKICSIPQGSSIKFQGLGTATLSFWSKEY